MNLNQRSLKICSLSQAYSLIRLCSRLWSDELHVSVQWGPQMSSKSSKREGMLPRIFSKSGEVQV